ncbi:MAG: vanadium-dependent haloperoxidase, partial [Cyanobacteria bacterium P01_D01_bin.50]
TRRNAGGFALYGGPHILNLVTEVSTRALKAVRFQKFNNHIRLRPEALAARIELLRQPWGKDIPPALCRDIGDLKKALECNQVDGAQSTLAAIAQLTEGNYFLPMAFPEGSPMHPAYGAGHATVAGACVTILKAFFDTSAVLAKKDGQVAFKRFEKNDQPVAFRAPEIPEGQILPSESNLKEFTPDQFLTLEAELNKLAANISIGRNMAGVHYFSDYYDSLRMGEEIAIGILEEQALTYPTDPFVLSVPTFDGDVVRIGAR